MEFKSKKRLTIIATGLFFFLGGVEYAIIMPTLYLYIQHLGGSPSYLGIVLSAFSFSGLLVAPIYGLAQDRMHKTKVLIIIANMFEIIGNFMYFMGLNLGFLLASRLIAGIGAGVQSTIFAQISRTTYEAERASAISLALALKQIGLLFGPGFNLFLVKFHFYIGPFEVNKFTIPGLFMFILWIIVQSFFLCCYYDLPTLSEIEEQNAQRNLKDVVSGPHTSALTSGVPRDTEYNEDNDNTKSLTDKKLPHLTNSQQALNIKNPWSWKDEYLREEIVVLLWAQFVFFFEKMCMETAITPMAQLLMDFGEIENSIMYCLCGAEVIICFILVKVVSKKLTDRVIIMIGFAIEMFPLVLLLFVYPDAPHHNRSANMAWFVIAVVTQVAGLAFCGVAIISLYSKLVSESTQGFSQGIRRSVGGVATIMGPLWAGGAVLMGYTMVGVMLFLFIMCTIMAIISWKHLKAPGDDDLGKPKKEIGEPPINNEEKAPLLINAYDNDIDTYNSNQST